MNTEIYEVNGLVFWTRDEIRLRRHFEDTLAQLVEEILRGENLAWKFHQIEAPLLTPQEFINQNYTNADVWMQEGGLLVLRPETTPGSYKYAQHLLDSYKDKPPFCVWQAGKSFRREQDQPSKHMRLKEFYQQEFQCIYTADTLNDYMMAVMEPLRKEISKLVGLEARIVASDRLPSYSQVTMDIEVDNGDKWMEVCSVSRRTDFPQKAKFQTKKGEVEKDLLVLEIAIGLDRLVYNYKSNK